MVWYGEVGYRMARGSDPGPTKKHQVLGLLLQGHRHRDTPNLQKQPHGMWTILLMIEIPHGLVKTLHTKTLGSLVA